MVQILEEVEKAEQLKMLERKEKEGLGGQQDIQETEATPAFSGLTQEVEEKLLGFLEQALEAWSRVELEVNDWMGSKTICDMLLALAWHQRRLGMSGREAFELAAKLARQLSESEHEVNFLGSNFIFLTKLTKVLALAELVRFGQCDMMERMVKVAETLEKSKTGTASGLQTGVVMAEVLYSTFVYDCHNPCFFVKIFFSLVQGKFVKIFPNVEDMFRFCSPGERLRVPASSLRGC